ncbi:MAG: MazG family protein [Deltaproteobacteria bacterium]|nr:MazG family protein [Deltaproteobacteria bacterium]
MEATKTDRCDGIEEILRIIERLLGENGCPWDRKQTPESVQTYLIEESHEAAAAVRAGKTAEVAEELGDVLFMAFFLVRLYERKGDFSLEDVCRLISEKMIRRHPHVFGEMKVNSTKEVKENWEKIKASEKQTSGKTAEPVPDSLPALMRAYRMLSRLSQKEGEQWSGLPQQVRQFARESDELASRIETDDGRFKEGLGRLLARLVNIARLKGYRAEDVLHDFLRKLE